MGMTEQNFVSRFNNDEFYRSLLVSFSNDLPAVLEHLQKFVSGEQFAEAAAVCHQMVGSSATYGYPALAGIFEHLESVLEKEVADHELIASDIRMLKTVGEKICEFTATLAEN